MGWLDIQRDRGQAKGSRWLADENRQCVLVLCALYRDVSGEDTSGIELRLRLRDIRFRSSPAQKSILRQLQGLAVCIDCGVEKILLCIGTAHFEVVKREFGVQAKPRGLKIRSTCLRLFSCRSQGAAYPSPKINPIREIEGKSEIS